MLPEDTTERSGRGARRSGLTGSRKVGRQQNYSPGKQRSIVPSEASKTRRINVSRNSKSEIQCRPTEEPNQVLTSGSSMVYERFSKAARSVLCSRLPSKGTMFFLVSGNLFHARHVREFLESTLVRRCVLVFASPSHLKEEKEPMEIRG